MGYLHCLPTCIILFQALYQTAWWGCHAQDERDQPDFWVSDDRQFKSYFNQAFDENSQNDGLQREELLEEEPNDVVLQMRHDEQEPNTDFENRKEYGAYKREAMGRRLKGKRRKMMKHNKLKSMLVHGKRYREQNKPDTDSLAEGNFTDSEVRKDQETSKYLESDLNIIRGEKSAFSSKSSQSDKNRNSMFNNKVKPAKQNENSVIPGNKIEEGKEFPDKNVANSSPSLVNNSGLILESEKENESFKVSTPEGPVLSGDVELHKKFHTKNLKLHKSKQKDMSAGSEEEETSSVKKHQKNKNSNEKFHHLNNIYGENEDRDTKAHNDKLRKHNLDRMIKIKLAQEDKQKQLQEVVKYANVSMINQGFMGAAEKKYLALQNEFDENTKSTFEPLDILTMKPVIYADSEVSKHIILNDKKNDVNENKDSHDKKEHKETFEEQESKGNDLLNSNEEVPKLDPNMHFHHKYKQKDKHFNQNALSKGKKSENPVLSEAEQEDLVPVKHKRRAKKKVHNNRVLLGTDESDFESGSSDSGSKMMEKELNTDLSNFQVDTVEEESKQRNEHDIAKRSHKLKYHDDRSAFGHFKNSRANDQVYDSDTNDDERNFRFEDDEVEEDQHQRTHQSINEDNGYQSKYLNSEVDRENVDSEDDPKKLFARRAHESKDDPGTTEPCVEYKAEIPPPTISSTSTVYTTSTVCTTPTFKTTTVYKVQTTCAGKPTTTKARTTPKTTVKSQSTKKPDSDSGQNLTSVGVVDAYEQFLCGQAADDFVNAVFEKVKRSKKIMKELGFQNDTDETCDRCIEMKPSKIPDLQTMRDSIGKCQYGVVSKQNSAKCYSVPKPMESFLRLLLSYEQEHESSVYSKIRDESSFIFTGDYPDSLTRNDNEMAISDKYNDEREDFNKDTFEKQHLREESNEEKSEDQIGNRNDAGHRKFTTLLKEKEVVEESTEAIIEGNDAEEIETETESNRDKLGKNIKDEGEQNLLQTEEDLKGNDVVDVFDTHDLSPRGRNKYATFKDIRTDYNERPVKRRKNYKNDKQRLQHGRAISKGLDMNAANKIDSKPNGIRSLGFFDSFLPKSAHNQLRNTQGNVFVSPYGQRDSFHVKDDRKHNIENNKFLSSHTRSENPLNTHSKINRYFGYNPEEFRSGKQLRQIANHKRRYDVPDSFVNSNWDNSEYQLYPNQPGETLMESPLDLVSRSRNYKNGYDELRMVKRDAEPQYEDESIFFEVPDIEYDFY